MSKEERRAYMAGDFKKSMSWEIRPSPAHDQWDGLCKLREGSTAIVAVRFIDSKQPTAKMAVLPCAASSGLKD